MPFVPLRLSLVLTGNHEHLALCDLPLLGSRRKLFSFGVKCVSPTNCQVGCPPHPTLAVKGKESGTACILGWGTSGTCCVANPTPSNKL